MNEGIELYKVYNGTKMRLFGWSIPVVIDLNGMRNPFTVPVLAPNEDGGLLNVGNCTAIVIKDALWIHTERDKSKYGYSIGVVVVSAEKIDRGSLKINGQIIEAPFYHVIVSDLREIVEQPNPDYDKLTLCASHDLKTENENLQRQVKNYREQIQCYEEIKESNEKRIKELRSVIKNLTDAAGIFFIKNAQFETLKKTVDDARYELEDVE